MTLSTAGEISAQARIFARLMGRALPQPATDGARPDPRQEGRVNRGLQRALISAGEAFVTLRPECGDITFQWGSDLGDLAGVLPQDGLVSLLVAQSDIDQEGQETPRGVIALSAGLIDALVEVQTTGRVDRATGPSRLVTRVDVVLARDFIDLVLAGLAREFGDFDLRDWPLRLALGEMVEERRRVPLILEERRYHLWKIPLDLGGGLRQGVLVLALPVIARAEAVAQAPNKRPIPTPTERAAWRASWARALGAAPVTLEAVLLRRSLPVFEVDALELGQMLTFAPAALEEIRLEDRLGRAVMKGRLGQKSGARALRLSGGKPAAPKDPAPLPAPAPAPAMVNPDPSPPPRPPDLRGAGLDLPDGPISEIGKIAPIPPI